MADEEVEYVASRDEGGTGEEDARRRNVIPRIWKQSCGLLLIGHIVMNIITTQATKGPLISSNEKAPNKFMFCLHIIAIALFCGTIFRSAVGFGFASSQQRPMLSVNTMHAIFNNDALIMFLQGILSSP